MPVLATAQSVLATSQALKYWTSSPVMMQTPLTTAGVVYLSGSQPRRICNIAGVDVLGLLT